MKQTRAATSLAAIGLLALAAACTGGGGGQRKAGSNTGFNAARTSIVNPSEHRGGVLRYAMPLEPDSFDPGNTYGWNAARLWSRALTTYRPLPGPAGLKLVPDLATSLGTVSDDGLTWTYVIHAGLRFSDGSPITSTDVKYAVERSNYAPEVLSNGPNYLRRLLRDNSPPYRGPYRDKSGELKSIQTPDATTIVFHLAVPFADFDYVVSSPQTAPVPEAKDDGANYVNHIVSSGSYTVRSYRQGRGAALVRNPYWDPGSDSVRKQYPDEIRFAFHHEQHGIDDDLLAGNLTLDSGGGGMEASSQLAVLSDPEKKHHADSVDVGAIDMLEMSTRVPPLDDINCRLAVQYAVDKLSVQTSIGGPLRGQIASTLLPPTMPGHVAFDLYATKDHAGDLVKSKAALARCGQPDGFTMGLSTLTDQAALPAAALSIQASLKRVGIRTHLVTFPSTVAWAGRFGAPAYVHEHRLGLVVAPWVADWSDGYGFLEQLIDGRAIVPTANSNLSELNDARVNGMFDAAMRNNDIAERERIWSEIDRAVMAKAVIVPLVYRRELNYRPPATTNVTVSRAYGGYDLLNIGTE